MQCVADPDLEINDGIRGVVKFVYREGSARTRFRPLQWAQPPLSGTVWLTFWSKRWDSFAVISSWVRAEVSGGAMAIAWQTGDQAGKRQLLQYDISEPPWGDAPVATA